MVSARPYDPQPMSTESGSATVDWSALGRPLPARSIIASLLLGMHPPRQSSARLVRWCGWFGVTENAARVALSRMVERGELTLDGGWYELTGSVRQRQRRQDWALAPACATRGTGRGCWWSPAASHARRRPALVGERPAPWPASVSCATACGRWPDNLPELASPADVWETVRAWATCWRGVPDVAPDLAASFGLDRWAARAELLDRRLSAAIVSLVEDRSTDAIVDGFVVGAAALAHLRTDPLLPEELLPAGWPGERLRRRYGAYQPAFAAVVAAAFRNR